VEPGEGALNPAPVLFAAAGLHARVLRADEVPRLQALFDANPGYFQTVNGRNANPDEAQVEFDELPPPHLSFRERWVLGVFDAAGALVGVVLVLSDLGAPGVWHLALFLLATALRGRGIAAALYVAMESWAITGGALWMRLGVVTANARGRRFWERCGYRTVRMREQVDTGGRLNDLLVCIKPLAGGSTDDYLALVPRDRPGSTLP
jgi:GNAT superfamily N-acetyltransferase